MENFHNVECTPLPLRKTEQTIFKNPSLIRVKTVLPLMSLLLIFGMMLGKHHSKAVIFLLNFYNEFICTA